MTSSELALLLVASLMGWLAGTAKSYVVDVIINHKPKAMMCWTCPKRTSNELCNRWSPNRECPTGYTLCQTVHRINTLIGNSVLVHKRCALPGECSIEMIGCHGTNTPGIEDCISCCNYPLCNKHAPSNMTSAVRYTILASSGARGLFRTRDVSGYSLFTSVNHVLFVLSYLTLCLFDLMFVEER